MYQACLHYPDAVMEVLSLLPKICRVINGDSEITRSSRAQDCATIRQRWLVHERCVKAVKASYSSIVFALENIYETSHQPEALGPSKALSSHSTIAAMYIPPQVAKLSRALQIKHLDFSFISSLVGAILNSLDDAILSSANWVLQDAREELKAATGIEVTYLDTCSFQERVGKPFIRLIKDNISHRFRSSSKDVLSAFSI